MGAAASGPRVDSKRSVGRRRGKPIDWPAYDRALVRRGNITVWFSEEAIVAWSPAHGGTRGGQKDYSELAIETVLTVRLVYKQALRQTEGFVASLLEMMGLELRTPDHSTLSRRGKSLGLKPLKRRSGEPVHVIVDSTGLKIYGAGEWSAVKHGLQRRRQWRKLHLAIDEETLEILGHALTPETVGDCSKVPALLDQMSHDVIELMGDGAYDSQDVYAAADDHNPTGAARVIVPPRKNATLSPTVHTSPTRRDRHVLITHALGRKGWENHVSYSRRLLVENAMYRYKTVIGRDLRSRDTSSQRTEAALGCKIVNRMTAFGLPRPSRAS